MFVFQKDYPFKVIEKSLLISGSHLVYARLKKWKYYGKAALSVRPSVNVYILQDTCVVIVFYKCF